MKRIVYLYLCVILAYCFFPTVSMSEYYNRDRLKRLADHAKKMFYHGYDNYMKYSFPKDELQPISCAGRDTLGSYSLTLIDSLDSLLIMGNKEEFVKGLSLISGNLSFDIDINVSVFETNIRILGGLLSTHLFAEDLIETYDGVLLEKAIDMGDRLFKAFDTKTGIPYGTVNLRYGVPLNEIDVTSTAVATTYAIEFGILSRLTGDFKYENAAKKAMKSIWNFRAPGTNLVGGHINITSGAWVELESSIGGNQDSFHEYLLKASILFGDNEYLDIFQQSYEAVMKYHYKPPWYVKVDMNMGGIVQATFESLQAFWPGLQALKGDLTLATTTMNAFANLCIKKLRLPPESYNLKDDKFVNGRKQYPLRPEMIESLYYLSMATEDPLWFQFGEMMMYNIDQMCKVKCGYAAIEDVETGIIRDHMDSFFLSETTKYLYLLFDRNNFINTGNYIFNTEGHPFEVKNEWLSYSQEVFGRFKGTCPNHRGHSHYFSELAHSNFQPAIYDLNRSIIASHYEELDNQAIKAAAQAKINSAKTIPNQKQEEEIPIENIKYVALDVYDTVKRHTMTQYGSLAAFGKQTFDPITSDLVIADPPVACTALKNEEYYKDKFVLVQRGECEFVQKALAVQFAGAKGIIVFDRESTALLTMTGSSHIAQKINIISVFLLAVNTLGDVDLLSQAASSPLRVTMREPKEDEVLPTFLTVEYESGNLLLQNIIEKLSHKFLLKQLNNVEYKNVYNEIMGIIQSLGIAHASNRNGEEIILNLVPSNIIELQTAQKKEMADGGGDCSNGQCAQKTKTSSDNWDGDVFLLSEIVESTKHP